MPTRSRFLRDSRSRSGALLDTMGTGTRSPPRRALARLASGARPGQGASRLLRSALALRVTGRVPAAQMPPRAVFDGPPSGIVIIASPCHSETTLDQRAHRSDPRASRDVPRRSCSGRARYPSTSMFILTSQLALRELACPMRGVARGATTLENAVKMPTRRSPSQPSVSMYSMLVPQRAPS
jgi:hypothetical protein